jgi:hypothetical protein
MENIMEIVHITKKGRFLSTLEGFHIYRQTKANNQSNARLIISENAIFETVIKEDPCRRCTSPPLTNSSTK